MAHFLATPLPDLMEMEWDEILLWHKEARRIAGLRGVYVEKEGQTWRAGLLN